MKILFVLPKLAAGGAELLVAQLCEHLKELGNDVKLICLHPSDVSYQNFPNKEFLDNQIQPIQITSTVIFKPFRKTRISNEEYKRIVDEYKPDVIHSNLYESEFVAYSYIRNGTKYFSHTHDNMPRLKGFSLATLWNKRKFTDYYESCWLKKRYGLANANFICISEDNKNALQKNIGKGFSKITCLPNAIDTAKFYSSNSKPAVFTITTTGNLVHNKGHLFLLEVARILMLRGHRFKLQLLGYGELMNELLKKINEMELKDFVELKGTVTNVNDYLAQSHLYVHAAYTEAFGLSILEAMASSLPVVAMDAGGNRELTVDGQTGFLLKERNAEHFADKVEIMMKDEVMRNQMGENAKKFTSQFELEDYIHRLLALYQA